MRQVITLSIALTIISLFCFPQNQAIEGKGTFTNKKLYSSNLSARPRISIDPESGTMAIVWCNSRKNDKNQKVFIKFITINNSGNAVIGKTRTIDKGGYHANIAFNSKNKLFLVVWTDDSLIKWRPSNIYGKTFNTKGHAVSKIRKYDTGQYTSTYPNIIYNTNKNQFLLVWQRMARTWGQVNSSGLFSMILKNNGAKLSKPVQVKAARYDYQGYVIAEFVMNGIYNSKSKKYFLIKNHYVPQKGSEDYKHLYQLYSLDSKGQFIQKVDMMLVKDYYLSWYAQIPMQKNPSGYHYPVWSYDSKLVTRKLSHNGSFEGQEKKIASLGSLQKNRVINKQSGGIAYSPEYDLYLIAGGNGKEIFARFMDSSGKLLGKKTVFAKKKTDRPWVAWNPVMNEFAIVFIQGDKLMLTTLPPNP